MTQEDFLNKTTLLLGIELNNQSISKEMFLKSQCLKDYDSCYDFIESRFTYTQYKMMKPFPKFIAMINDYVKDNVNLNRDQLEKVYTYSEKLFSKATYVLDELNWQLQSKGITIKDVKDYSMNFKDDENKVLNLIGSKDEVFNLAVFKKQEFKDKIESVVSGLSKSKNKLLISSENDNKISDKVLKLINPS